MSGTRLTWIPAPFVHVATAYRLDLTQYVVGGIYLPPSAPAIARLWKVNLSDLSNGGEIVFANDAGKDDSLALEILANGDLLVTIAEALPGASGSTAQPEVYRIAGVFPRYAASAGAVDQTLRNALAALPK